MTTQLHLLRHSPHLCGHYTYVIDELTPAAVILDACINYLVQ